MFDKKPESERASGPMYSPNCMKLDCHNKTEVVLHAGGSLITRCCQCYDRDLRLAGKQQLRIDEEPYRREADNQMRGKLGAVLREIVNKQRVAA